MAKKQRKTTNKKNAKQEAKQKQDQMMIAIAALIFVVIAFLVFGSNPSQGNTATVNSLPAEINTAMAYEKFEEPFYH